MLVKENYRPLPSRYGWPPWAAKDIFGRGTPLSEIFFRGCNFLGVHNGAVRYNVQIAFLHSRKGALPLVLHSQI